MTRTDFLIDPDTQAFMAWFESAVVGTRPTDFPHNGGVDRLLSDSFERYRWPVRRIDLMTPMGEESISARSSFHSNAILLWRLSMGIQDCLNAKPVNHDELANWARVIMEWGGVFKRPGNGTWLDSMGGELNGYFERALPALIADDEQALEGVRDLRSNAGTTKIHSLVLANFVIYDSRVAAALAWLVQSWAKSHERAVPEHLRFGCMRANTKKVPRTPRTPDATVFKYFSPSRRVSTHRKHAIWNRRANWIIEHMAKAPTVNALGVRLPRTWSGREIEAALFMMGEDLTHAL
ncbi:hypothetical protein [Pseudomonas monteilii]|uniref:Uncharacterized protein n=1 Tax=Pseudomonas monteilii TaxID=76759 RepID=A0A399M7C5_9PSED|nr:hypothetical protein [Pseudomonas monteilii]RII76796.1 hypothetical protein D0894_15280 [Pseudomonas monteilii]